MHYSAIFNYHVCINNSNTRYHSSFQVKQAALGLMYFKLTRHLGNRETIDLKCCSYVVIVILLMNRTLNKDEPVTESALTLVCNRGLFIKIKCLVALQPYHVIQNKALHLQCLS